MAKVMEVRVITPEQVVFEGTARSLVAPACDGSVGVLPGHAPFLTLIGEGRLEVDTGGSGGKRSFGVGGGVLKVESDIVTVLADRIAEDAHPGGDETDAA